MEPFFESRTNLQGTTGRLRFVQHQPVIHPEPVLRADTFADQLGVSLYGTVLREGGEFRMWYQAMPGDWDFQNDVALVAHATSKDGLHWEKKPLGVVDYGGRANHLCNFNLHCPSLFIDPNAPASHRYRGSGYSHPSLQANAAGRTEAGYYTVHSADGLNWCADAEEPRWRSGDVITSIYHPGQRRGITAMKYAARVQRIDRRCIHTASYSDGVFGDDLPALYPDEYDDLCAMSRGYASCDYYGMGMMPAGQGTIGFLWNFWHELPYVGKHQCALYGTSDITLLYQPAPGAKWFHMPGRPSFIDHRELPWMNGWIYSASAPVEVGDEQWLYFTGVPIEHGFYLNADWKRDAKWAQHMAQHQAKGVIGVARWPKDRLFGIEASREGALNLDLGVQTGPVRLLLNYTTRPGGSVRVEVPGVPERSLAEATPLEGSALGAEVGWRTGPLLHPPADGGPLVVRLHLELATLYAYQTASPL